MSVDFSWERCHREWKSEVAFIVPDSTGERFLSYRDKPEVLPTSLIDDTSLSEIVAAVKEMLNIDSAVIRQCLYSEDRTFEDADGDSLSRSIYVVEVESLTTFIPKSFQWTDIKHPVVSYSIPDGQRLIDQELSIIAEAKEPRLRSVWRRRGWFRKASDWIGEVFRERGIRVTEPLEQVTLRTTSTVLKVRTDCGVFFVKYSDPSTPDARILAVLNDIAPDVVEAPFFVDVDRICLITRDHGEEVGTLNDGCHDGIFSSLAILHDGSRKNIGRLVDAGLQVYDVEFLEQNTETMLEDIRVKFQIENDDWHKVERNKGVLKKAMEDIKKWDFPLSFVHNDFLIANVFRNSGEEQYRFFDFGESFIGNPLFDLSDGSKESYKAYFSGTDVEIPSEQVTWSFQLYNRIINVVRYMYKASLSDDCVKGFIRGRILDNLESVASAIDVLTRKFENFKHLG